jgi:hypothetical protein
MFSAKTEGVEKAIWLSTDFGAPTTIDWSTICRLTERGSELGLHYARVITLPSPPVTTLDTRYTTYQVSEEQLVINLLPPFFEKGFIDSEKGRESLQWIVESQARRTCVVNWSAGNADATWLPYLPDTIKELKLCGMLNFLKNKVPHPGLCNSQHWLHNFVSKLRYLERLTLSGCGYRPEDLPPLRTWTGSLNIYVEEK